jgi:pimeloyl-ACP methyl ester carboxylesterase
MSWYILFQQLPRVSERSLDWLLPTLWKDWCPPGYDASEDLQHVFDCLPDPRHRTAALSYYRAQFRPLRRSRQHRDLDPYANGRKPLLPMLVMHGRVDGAIDHRIGTLGCHALPVGSRHEVIEGAGHFMHLDQPGVVHELIGDYVGV